MSCLCVYISVPCPYQVPWRLEESTGSPGTGIAGGCEPHGDGGNLATSAMNCRASCLVMCFTFSDCCIRQFSLFPEYIYIKKLIKTYFANALVFYVGAFHPQQLLHVCCPSANDGWLLKLNLRLSLGEDFELSPRVQNDSISRNGSLQKKLKM